MRRNNLPFPRPLTSSWSWRARKEGAVRTLPTSSWMMRGLLSYIWMVHALSSRTTTGTCPPLASSCAPRPWSRPWALCCVREKLEEKTWARVEGLVRAGYGIE